ncbi:dienelactone hydrolase family protein [Sciscionella marina]|uniref:dienelactone hydrolase family protein n=1 Tax=Sciscionella marina TaxID=508770 RepID=UPI000372B81E|nr:dienelactone hydrolase family protein [Sciscionella marina]
MDITVPTISGDQISGYLAEPLRAGNHPGVVVIHDAIGLSDDTKAITERFASAGYLALAPNLYSRGGIRCIKTVFRAMLSGQGPAFDDIDAARGLLADRPDCTGKVGVVGFCMGGGFALVAAAKGFDASAPYYGQLPKDLSVLDEACPIVASFGKKDRTLPGAADKLETKLTERNIPHDVMEYPNAGHSFANRIAGPLNVLAKFTGFGYCHEESEHAWRRVLSFFAEHMEERE